MIQRVLLILGGLVSAARGDDGRDLRLLIMHNHPSWSTGEDGDEDYLIMIIDISIIDHLLQLVIMPNISKPAGKWIKM